MLKIESQNNQSFNENCLEERVKLIVKNHNIKYKRFSDIIEQDLITNYFLDKLKDDEVISSFPGNKTKFLIASDYYLRFRSNDKKKVKDLLKKISFDNLIDYFTFNLIDKDIRRYKKQTKNINPLLEYRLDINSEIVSKEYINMLKNNKLKNLIKQSYDIKDLKAIIFMDVLMPMLDKIHLEKIINSELNPEQKALEFSRQYQTHKEIVHERDKIGLHIENLDNYNVALETAFQDQVLEEDISLLYDTKKAISDSLKFVVYPENKAILKEYKSHLQDLRGLFNKKAAKGMEIIRKNMLDVEKKYNLSDNDKKGYFAPFIRKKKFESAKRELSEYHNQFNKIKKIIQT